VLLNVRRGCRLADAIPGGYRASLSGLFVVAGMLGLIVIDYEHWPQLWMGGAMLAAALLSELLLVWLRPTADRPESLRVFAFVAPVFLFGAYFVALSATEGTWWSIHLWGGAVFLTGIAGLLLSYLLAPPAIPDDDAMG